MPTAEQEKRRLKVLAELAILSSSPEAEFQALTEAARNVVGTKIALLSLVDADRVWFKGDAA